MNRKLFPNWVAWALKTWPAEWPLLYHSLPSRSCLVDGPNDSYMDGKWSALLSGQWVLNSRQIQELERWVDRKRSINVCLSGSLLLVLCLQTSWYWVIEYDYRLFYPFLATHKKKVTQVEKIWSCQVQKYKKVVIKILAWNNYSLYYLELSIFLNQSSFRLI